MIEVKNLSKSYMSGSAFSFKKKNAVHAVNDVSFQIGRGQIYGLLGVNGAGKTTLVKMLSTLLLPTAGNAYIGGYDVVKDQNQVRALINMVSGGDRMLYWRLTGRENLNYFADLYNVDTSVKKTRIEKLLEIVDLAKVGDVRVEKYSKGMKQRLQIARGLINDPQVLFMDEPTLGLDAPIARELRQLIKFQLGKTTLFTSHYIAEVEEICDTVAIIHKGKILTHGTPAELRRQHRTGDILSLSVTSSPQNFRSRIEEFQKKCPYEISLTTTEDGYQLRLVLHDGKRNQALEIVQAIASATSSQLVSFHFEEPSLEDVLVKVVGAAD